jgi:ABC-type multidrug transport system ATPase subunit
VNRRAVAIDRPLHCNTGIVGRSVCCCNAVFNSIRQGDRSLTSLSLPFWCSAWRDISYSIHVGAGKNMKEKHILKNIHGSTEPGRLIAIMGPTGSGKTSLLNVLAARTMQCRGASLSGEILLDGKPRDEESFRQHSAYVQQDDVVYAHQTVGETLQMAADLRLREASREQSSRLVASLIQQLGLVRAKDTEIGNSRVRGVSGGERKRTNIGIELTADPGESDANVWLT